jgi:hypothetical protein
MGAAEDIRTKGDEVAPLLILLTESTKLLPHGQLLSIRAVATFIVADIE